MKRRGLTLLEALFSLVLLAAVVFSAQVVTVGLLRGTRRSEAHQPALVALQYTLDKVRLRARQLGPAPLNFGGTTLGFAYQVDELAPLENPDDRPQLLPIRRWRVRLEFPVTDARGQSVMRSYEATTSVAL